MTRSFIYNFIRQHKFGVLSTVSPENNPQSAYIGFAVTTDLTIIFDTVTESRKYRNICVNPNVSMVIGWDSEQTIQYEGIASIPNNITLEKLLPAYYEVFPDGKDRRENWKNLAYICIEPTWIRYSDFNKESYKIDEIKI